MLTGDEVLRRAVRIATLSIHCSRFVVILCIQSVCQKNNLGVKLNEIMYIMIVLY